MVSMEAFHRNKAKRLNYARKHGNGQNNGSSRCSDESKIEIFSDVAEGSLFSEGLEKHGGGSLQV